MSARVFQSVIVQMRDVSPRVIGVADDTGAIISCSNLELIGSKIGEIPNPEKPGTEYTYSGRTFNALISGGKTFQYFVFADGEDELATTLCRFAAVAIAEAKSRFDESNDRSAFLKAIISDNILAGDIGARSKDLGLASDKARAVFLLRRVPSNAGQPTELLRAALTDKQTQFVIQMNALDHAVIIETDDDDNANEIINFAQHLKRKVSEFDDVKFTIGVGSVARSLRELANRYKEAQTAIEVGKVFDSEQTIVYYDNLGLGRLVYQLPTKLCEMFLSEVFKKNPIESLDTETLYTIYKFFENSLNVSETSRKLFVHRNTLVYRLEKIKKLTGLDLREFDHAIVFKVALMVRRYLSSQEARFDQSILLNEEELG